MSITKALPRHHAQASLLIHQSGPAAFEYIFHRSHGPNIKSYLSNQFRSDTTMFSHKHHIVWEENETAIGTIGIFTKKSHDQLFLQNAGSIFKHYGIRSILKGLKFELNLVKPPKRKRFYIGHIAVDKNHQGKGIARELIKEAENLARQNGFKVMALDVASKNYRALGLYELLGFKKIALNKSYNQALDDHIYMEKSL